MFVDYLFGVQVYGDVVGLFVYQLGIGFFQEQDVFVIVCGDGVEDFKVGLVLVDGFYCGIDGGWVGGGKVVNVVGQLYGWCGWCIVVE